MEKRFEQNTYVICHNGTDVIHPFLVESGTLLVTGQPLVEEFQDKDLWVARLQELNYDMEELNLMSYAAPAD